MISSYDAYAREAYWAAVSVSTKSNKATKEIAVAEAKAWRQVAATISILTHTDVASIAKANGLAIADDPPSTIL